MKLKDLIDHIINVYGFEFATKSSPTNSMERLKENIYNKIGSLGDYFRKSYPVKYYNASVFLLDESSNYDTSLWIKRDIVDKNIYYRVILKRIPPEASIYTIDTKKLFKPQQSDNFALQLECDRKNLPVSVGASTIIFPLNLVNGIESIDAYFKDFKELKESLREYKLNQLV